MTKKIEIVMDEYIDVLEKIKERITQAQYQVMTNANVERNILFWNIGNVILQYSKWGNKFVETLSKDLRMTYPSREGYSVRNLNYMKQFARRIPSEEILHQGGAKISWRAIKLLIDKTDNLEEHMWYTQQALFYARSNYVEKDYALKKISLRQTTGEVLKKNRRVILKSCISIDIHDLDLEVYSDSKWLAFILEQILSNSIKYMGEGERKLEWYAEKHAEQVRLCLRDTGVGIPAKDLPRVFEKGFTGENGRTGRKSTGMGLYLCKKLCEKMGHCIEILSSEGQGCLVILRFPVGSMTGELL